MNNVTLKNNCVTLIVQFNIPFVKITHNKCDMKKVGYALILIGLVLTIFTTVTFFSRERVAKIGDINITANKRHHLKWSPLVGIAVMATGGLVVWLSAKK